MRFGTSAWMVAAGITALVSAGCHRDRGRTAEGTLSLLRDSLATHNPPLERVADTRLLGETLVMSQAISIEQNMGIPFTEHALETMLHDSEPRMNPTNVFAGVLPMLRQGHCEKLADAPMPEPMERVPAPGERWPQSARDLQISVARRLTNAFAADYRCDGGPSFRAAFGHPYPDDGTLRVIYIGPAGRP